MRKLYKVVQQKRGANLTWQQTAPFEYFENLADELGYNPLEYAAEHGLFPPYIQKDGTIPEQSLADCEFMSIFARLLSDTENSNVWVYYSYDGGKTFSPLLI